MLSNAYFLAKFRFDTAENEPAKNLQNFPNFAKLRLWTSLVQVERSNFKGTLEADIRELEKAHRLLMLQVEESEKTCTRLTKEVIVETIKFMK